MELERDDDTPAFARRILTHAEKLALIIRIGLYAFWFGLRRLRHQHLIMIQTVQIEVSLWTVIVGPLKIVNHQKSFFDKC